MAMNLSRRGFLRSVTGTAAATAAAAALPFAIEPLRASTTPSGTIALDSNENAYGAPESALRAMRNAMGISNRYPDFANDDLAHRLSAMFRVRPEQLTFGCGSGELLKIAAETFTGPNRSVVVADPTFELIAHIAERGGAKTHHIALTKDHHHDLDAMLVAAKAGAGLVYICNPNNPTATITPRAEIEKFLAAVPEETVVLIDEAYHHFVDSPEYVSFLEKPFPRERLIVLRTFSKIYGMAGLRLGFGVAPPKLIEAMSEHSFSSNVNCIAGKAAVAVLDDPRCVPAAAQRNARDRAEFFRQAEHRKLSVIPSQANFVMVDSRRPVREVIQHFRENSIRVGRPFPPYDTHVRVSLSTPADMATFWRVWDKMPARA
jgi:histidinol-phosphate aminotransferase